MLTAENIRGSLEDIVSRLRHGDYKNEEHVRLSLVCRLLTQLGWDIWNPREVYSEFGAIPSEDATRVDLALFMPPELIRPAVFIEVKAVGKLAQSRAFGETQLRDYNRNNQAQISVLTDGKQWHFYLASASGEFSQRRFESFDLGSDNTSLEEVELALDAFLSKVALQNGGAVIEAQKYLKRTDTEKTMAEVLPLAQRDLEGDPTANLLDKFLSRCAERGVNPTRDQALNFLRSNPHRQLPVATPTTVATSASATAHPQPTPHISNFNGARPFVALERSEGLYSLQGNRGAEANGRLASNGRFLVFSGSFASEATPGFIKDGKKSFQIWRELIESGVLKSERRGDFAVYRLTKDYEFNSISAAASVMLGASASGPREWK